MAEPRQELKDFFKTLGEKQKINPQVSAAIPDVVADAPIDRTRLNQLFEGVLTANGATVPQRQEWMNQRPIPSMTWNQLFDPNTKVTFQGKEVVLGKALLEAIGKDGEAAQNVRDLITKGFPNNGIKPLIPEFGGGQKPDGRAPWAPPPPAAPAPKKIPISIQGALEEAKASGFQTSVLARDESAPPVPDVRAAKTIQI